MLKKKPLWLKQKILSGAVSRKVKSLIEDLHLNTVCSEAKCPNAGECFSAGTATFLILGNQCTRSCGFCAIGHGPPQPPDPDEPYNIAEAAENLGLKHVVITSVTRDDLPDGGAGHFTAVIHEIRNRVPHGTIEILVPDFGGELKSIETIVSAQPDIINHNIETVPRLYKYARPESDYQRSLSLLSMVHRINPAIKTKSGMMLGLGENADEIMTALHDLINTGCSLITLGQYLQPSEKHLPVSRFVSPEEFEYWKVEARKLGFKGIASGPFVRSSYNAGKLLDTVKTHITIMNPVNQKNHRA
ncbi:lipoyl synthase [Candidatus Latescibacterota bacterium]